MATAARKSIARKAAPKDAAITKVELVFTRETKNTVRYDAEAEDAHVTSLYVSKAAFNGTNYPQTVTVTVGSA